ncbi:unnamed protein product [Absidia cylindrospora]
MVNGQLPLIPQSVGSSTLEHNQNRQRELAGLLCMALSALGFSTMSLFVKLSGASFPSFEIVFARSIVQLVLGLIGCHFLGVHPLGNPKVRPWLVFRGLVGSLGLALFFYSITQLPLADATVISSWVLCLRLFLLLLYWVNCLPYLTGSVQLCAL